jgi:alkylated DNA repair dioxygenase AlkB
MTTPVQIAHNFLTTDETSKLFNALTKEKWDVRPIARARPGIVARRENITYYEGDEAAAKSYTRKPEYAGTEPRPYSDAPPELQALRTRLQKMSTAGNNFSLCYINKYPDEKMGIGLHRDREEEGSTFKLVMVTLGGTRTFSIWKAATISIWKRRRLSLPKKERNKLILPDPDWNEDTEDGDLVVMPVGFHNADAYFHAVLPQKKYAAPRFSLTFRNPDLSADGPWTNCPIHQGFKNPCDACREIAAEAPHVFCCKAGHEYPKGAIYVGCRTVRGQKRAGTIFGNALNPLTVRNKKSNPWAAPDEETFRAYALKKMKDPTRNYEFRARVESLKGKNLLCWCEQEGPGRAEFCHARVWLEAVNGGSQ